MFSHVDEDVDACSYWEEFRGLQSEVTDGLTSDGILMVVQGEDDLCGVLEVLYWDVDREEMVPDEEHEFQEGA